MSIYFQVVKDVSATHSGVLCIPPVIGLFVSVILGGSGTSFFGYYAPFMIATSVLTPIAAGLLTTVTVNTPFVILIVYQAFLGFAAGIGFQGPQTAASRVFAPADQPLGIAAILFAQNFGPALFVPVAQTIFEGRLVAYLEQYFPQVGGTALSNMGLLDLKARVGSKDLGAALVGYDEVVTKTFYLPLALSCVSIIGALGMEWKRVKTKRS
jgi:MFS family permease